VKYVAGLLLLACASVQAAGMTELRYMDQDPGSAPYLTRILITERFLRLDNGQDDGDYALLDRQSGQVVNVLHDPRILMRMANHPLPVSRPLAYTVEEKVLPVREGTVRVQIFADGMLCSETVAAKGLLPDAARALAEFKSALAYTQLQTYRNTPEELRQPCDLAHHVWESGRGLAYGLPLEERDYAGRVRRLSENAMKNLDSGLFDLPEGYVAMQPPEAGQTGPSLQPSAVQAR
jgi:hypothetical protein